MPRANGMSPARTAPRHLLIVNFIDMAHCTHLGCQYVLAPLFRCTTLRAYLLTDIKIRAS